LRFTQKSLRSAGVSGCLLVHELDRHPLTELLVASRDNNSHSASPEDSFDFVLACDHGTDGGRARSRSRSIFTAVTARRHETLTILETERLLDARSCPVAQMSDDFIRGKDY
jgi:hypothetical protein